MNTKTFILVLILVLIGVTLAYLFIKKPSCIFGEPEPETELPNPAAVYCEEQGGTLEDRVFSAGVRGFCLFEDGSECNQWEFYRGECQKGDLKIEVLEEGTGEPIEEGNTALVHYTGTLVDGTKFDSSLERGEPFSFLLGAGQVITGWDKGVLGMEVGEKRKLTIAPDWAYANRGAGAVIPPGATLIFEVELLEIR